MGLQRGVIILGMTFVYINEIVSFQHTHTHTHAYVYIYTTKLFNKLKDNNITEHTSNAKVKDERRV